MRRTLVGTEPSEGTVNGRFICIYVSDENDGFDLLMLKLDPEAEHGADPLHEWTLPDMVDARAFARKLLEKFK